MSSMFFSFLIFVIIHLISLPFGVLLIHSIYFAWWSKSLKYMKPTNILKQLSRKKYDG